MWVPLLVSVCVIWVAAQRLELTEGDVCRQENGILWSCKPFRNCPKAQADKRNGKNPEICETRGNEDIVCCEPDKAVPPTGVGKSKEMCQKYGESVYIVLPDPVTDGETKVDTCAVAEPLITNGMDAEPREYPHMALIGYEVSNKIQWLCGGTLISDRFVLSAAHCTDGGRRNGLAKWVRLGEYNIKSKRDDDLGYSQPVNYEIEERINHPEYVGTSVYNDITLYKLKKKVVFNEYIRPICLNTEHQFAKTYVIATGWGKTKWGDKGSAALQKVNLTITPRKLCSDMYEESISSRLANGIIDEKMFCAGDLDLQKDTCNGDSGGPLQLRLADPYCMYTQVGITSFGSRCGGNKPGVYTRISHFVPWIESVVWP